MVLWILKASLKPGCQCLDVHVVGSQSYALALTASVTITHAQV